MPSQECIKVQTGNTTQWEQDGTEGNVTGPGHCDYDERKAQGENQSRVRAARQNERRTRLIQGNAGSKKKSLARVTCARWIVDMSANYHRFTDALRVCLDLFLVLPVRQEIATHGQ